MNRLVIIGNGFDMEQGLKASYMDFINWYWEKRLNALLVEQSPISEDCLCKNESNALRAFIVTITKKSALRAEIIQIVHVYNTIHQSCVICLFHIKELYSDKSKGIWQRLEPAKWGLRFP